MPPLQSCDSDTYSAPRIPPCSCRVVSEPSPTSQTHPGSLCCSFHASARGLDVSAAAACVQSARLVSAALDKEAIAVCQRVGVSVLDHSVGARRSWEASQSPQMGGLETYKAVNCACPNRIDQVDCDVHEKDREDEGQHRGGGWQDRDQASNATAQARRA